MGLIDDLRKFHSETYELEAIDSLANPSGYAGLPKLDERLIEYQIITVPSFEPYRTWTVYRGKDGDRTVRRIAWHRSEDFREPIAAPTTFGADARLSAKEGAALGDRLSSIVVPAFQISDGLVLDGVRFGIRSASFLQSSEISWWCDPPDAWSDLAAWYEDAVSRFDSVLPDRTPSA